MNYFTDDCDESTPVKNFKGEKRRRLQQKRKYPRNKGASLASQMRAIEANKGYGRSRKKVIKVTE
jgi:hypothetical protein